MPYTRGEARSGELGSHQLLTSLPPLQWCFPRTCWRRAWKRTTLPCWDPGDTSFQVTEPGQGPKCGGGEGFHGEGNTAFLTRRGKKEGLGCAIPPSPPAQGLVKGSTSTHGAPIWAGPRRDAGEQDCLHGAWLGEQTLLKSCRNKCI